jgi:hypothetical protein
LIAISRSVGVDVSARGLPRRPSRIRAALIDQLLVGLAGDVDHTAHAADGGDGAEHAVDRAFHLLRDQVAAVGIGLRGELGLDLELAHVRVGLAPLRKKVLKAVACSLASGDS